MKISQKTTAAYNTFQSVRFFGSLDGLRALSILAVLWHHAMPLQDAVPIGQRGFLGVDLFFVISGFLIPTLLLRERERWGAISLAGFYWRRFLRIFPPYYLVLGIYAAIFLLLAQSGRAATYWQELPFYLSYTSNWIDAEVFGIAWSLACEEQFYLLLPPLMILLSGRWLAVFGLFFLLLNQLVNFGVLDGVLATLIPNAEHLEVLQATFTPIVLGVFLAFLMNKPQGYFLVRAILGYRWSIVIIAIALLVFLMIPNDDISGLHRLVIQMLLTLLVGAAVVREDHGFAGFLQLAPLRRLGRVSYGVYLYHLLVLDFSLRLISPNAPFYQALLLMTVIILSWLVAEASFRFMEKPLLRLRGRIGSHPA